MSKPSELRIDMTHQGPILRVRSPSRAERLIWRAVEEANIEGMSTEHFIREVRKAWSEELDRDKERKLESIR